MHSSITITIYVAATMLVVIFYAAIWASRYVKVGPNQVLIVSGRKIQQPDGRFVGFRVVKGGGTFVIPVIEKVDVLSLEAFTIEMPRSKARTAKGEAVEADCVAQVKIQSDDASIVAAAEHFLSKSEQEIKGVVTPVLEKRLRTFIGSLSAGELSQNPGACVNQIQAAVSTDLNKMGLGIISFDIREIHLM